MNIAVKWLSESHETKLKLSNFKMEYTKVNVGEHLFNDTAKIEKRNLLTIIKSLIRPYQQKSSTHTHTHTQKRRFNTWLKWEPILLLKWEPILNAYSGCLMTHQFNQSFVKFFKLWSHLSIQLWQQNSRLWIQVTTNNKHTSMIMYSKMKIYK